MRKKAGAKKGERRAATLFCVLALLAAAAIAGAIIAHRLSLSSGEEAVPSEPAAPAGKEVAGIEIEPKEIVF